MNGAATIRLQTPLSTISALPQKQGKTVSEYFAEANIPSTVPVICVLNGEPLLRADWGYSPTPEDDVAFVAIPQGVETAVKAAVAVVKAVAAAISSFALSQPLLAAAALLGASFVLNALLAPKFGGAASSPEGSPTYSIGAQGNSARLLQPIPRGYGTFNMYPDFASQPYASYEGNDQILYQLFCLGLGEYEVHEVRIEDTPLWNDEDGYTDNFEAVEIEIVPPGETVTLFPAAVVTSVEVSNQELRNNSFSEATTFAGSNATINATGADHRKFENLSIGDQIVISGTNAGTYTITDIDRDSNSDTFNRRLTVAGSFPSNTSGAATYTLVNTVGAYVVNASNTVVNKIAVDFVLPGGLYYANDNGSLSTLTLALSVEARLIDSFGAPLGSWAALGSPNYTRATATAQRFTELYDVTPGRYEVRVTRTSQEDFRNRSADTIIWEGLRGFIPSTNAYPGVTLLAVKIRATNQLSGQSARRFNTVQTGKVPIWNGATWSAPTATQSIAWAVADMLRNAEYGEGRSDALIDLPKLLQLDATWTARGDKFNGIFDTKRTFWDAVTTLLQAGRAQPLLIGGVVTFMRDEQRQLAKGVFTPRNIRRGSFETTHILYDNETPDDIIVEYFDERTWKLNEVTCALPGSTGENPARIQILGVTNYEQAWREGIYQAAANMYRRIMGSLSTEMEGKLLVRGDPVLVSHDMAKWGLSGEVESYDEATLSLSLSEPCDWSGDGPWFMVFSDKTAKQFGPVQVLPGGSDDIAIFDADDLQAVEEEQERSFADIVVTDPNKVLTRFAFGEGATYAKRFLVTGVRPQALDNVNVALVIDDPRVYTADEGEPPEEGTGGGPGTDPSAPVVASLTVTQDPSSPASPVLLNASWTPAAGATSYVFQVSYDEVSWNTVYEGSTASTQFTALAGPIFFRVAGVNAFTGPWAYFDSNFGTPTANPSEVTNLEGYGSLAEGIISANWTAGARATSYLVEVVVGGVVKLSQETAATGYIWSSSEVIAAGGFWASFDVRVTAKNAAGSSSPVTDTVSGIVLVTSPTLVSITSAAADTTVQVRLPTDTTFTIVKVYRGATTNFADAVQIGSDLTGALGEIKTVGPVAAEAGVWYHFARAFNSSGDASAVVGPSIGYSFYGSGANLFTQPEAFDNAAWTKTNLTVDANVAAMPGGAMTMDRLKTTSTSAPSAVQNVTLAAAPAEFSIFAKQDTLRYLVVNFQATGFDNHTIFDLQTGVISFASGGSTRSIEDWGNGVYRCVVTRTATAGSRQIALHPSSSGTSVVSPAANQGVFVGNAKIKQ